MRKWISLSSLIAIVLLIGFQLVPIDATNPPVESDIPTHPEVKAVLRRACYDCHSNETVWPWYSRFAPISWMISRDVHEGRSELNFSTWDQYTAEEQLKKLKDSWGEVEEGGMPPWYYLSVHRDAALSSADRALLWQWTVQR
jgi:Haem-binding domain